MNDKAHRYVFARFSGPFRRDCAAAVVPGDGRRWWRLVAIFAFLMLSCSHQPNQPSAGRENEIVRYLGHADRQAETQEQRQEIKHALEDMLKLSPQELRKRRYADYQMQPAKWTLTELIRKYFSPWTLMDLDDKRFYDDLREPEAKEVIRRQLREVERAIEAER